MELPASSAVTGGGAAGRRPGRRGLEGPAPWTEVEALWQPETMMPGGGSSARSTPHCAPGRAEHERAYLKSELTHYGTSVSAIQRVAANVVGEPGKHHAHSITVRAFAATANRFPWGPPTLHGCKPHQRLGSLSHVVTEVDNAETVAIRIGQHDEVRVVWVAVPVDLDRAKGGEPRHLGCLLGSISHVQVHVQARVVRCRCLAVL